MLDHIRKVYGQDRVANVLTLRTEAPKSAILAAARSLSIDVDIGQYLASLIPMERGKLWTLHECMYGNNDDKQPIKQFVYEMTENYPELWEIVQRTEGLIVGYGTHAGGIVFVDEPFENSMALMRAPNGVVQTQFELHTLEKASGIKYDMLSVEAIDKIQICLDLLIEKGLVKKYPTLRETYENALGIYTIERDDPKMWQMVWEHKILSLFQMDSAAGGHGIDLIHPKGVGELATLNSVIRLMAPEKGAEQPLEMWARYRQDITQWYSEMKQYGLSEDEIQWLSQYPDISDGIAESQEALMKLTMEDRLGGNSLQFADKCRKALAKKVGKLFIECEQKFFETAKEKGCSEKLVTYVWYIMLRVQRSYAFNKSHTLAYSLVALQEMNLAYKYPIIFWNCACLISDAGGAEDETNTIGDDIEIFEPTEEYVNEMEEFTDDDSEEDIEESYDEEDCDGYPAEVEVMKSGKKKKKIKATNYGKISTAIGKISSAGISIALPNINESSFTFSPSVKDNKILYGLSGITRIGEELVKTIVANRPYSSISDFLDKVKINKPQMINLIKSGAFDIFGERRQVMHEYINLISDTKTRITLQNLNMLIDFGLIPDKYDLQRRVYKFNKYIKKLKLNSEFYGLDNIAFNFYSTNFDVDKLISADDTESSFKIKQLVWDNIYKKQMDIIRPYVKDNAATLLTQVNTKLTQDLWDKYCTGSVSKWEMDSISCYIHNHELAWIDNEKYGLSNFSSLSENPEIERVFPYHGKMIPLFRLFRIAGTVLDRNKAKKTVTLLTTDGVVTVKIYGVFANYDKQISERGADGKKHVLRKSEFSRGNKIIVTGIRSGDDFIGKKYKNTPHHIIETIEQIDDTGAIKIYNRSDETV